MAPEAAMKMSTKPGRAGQIPKAMPLAARTAPRARVAGHAVGPGNRPTTPAPSSMSASARSSGRGAMRRDHHSSHTPGIRPRPTVRRSMVEPASS